MVELKIVLEVFRIMPSSFNWISDSQYVVNAIRMLEATGPIKKTVLSMKY